MKATTLAMALALLPAAAWAEQVEGGVNLPNDSRRVGEHRYRMPGNWEQTAQFLKAVYKEADFPRRNIANQPGIRAIHIANPMGRGFEGLNVYEANDEVRVFVVTEPEPPKPVRPAKAAVKKRVTRGGRGR